MKIIIETDDGEIEVHQYVTDYYFAFRKVEPLMSEASLAYVPEVRSFSRGVNIRELVKELAQSLIELQEYLKNGASSK